MKRIFEADSSTAISPLRVLHQPLNLVAGLARHDVARLAFGAGRRRQLDLGEAMSVGRDRAQHDVGPGACDVQVDAVEVVARLLGRDRELGLLDQALEVGRGERELVRHVAGRDVGEVALRQGLQREARAPGPDGEHRAVARGLEHDLRALGELAHDLVEHVRRHRGDAARRDLAVDRLDHLEIEIGRLERKLCALGADQHVGENRDGVAPLDHAVDVGERSQELGALDRDLHAGPRSIGKGNLGARTHVAASSKAPDGVRREGSPAGRSG